MASFANAQNLLFNGNFNTDLDGNPGPDHWTSWAYGTGGWADYKVGAGDSFAMDGSPYINAGNWSDWWTGGGGWYQVVPGVAGTAYTLRSFCATEGWDNAAGEMRLIFLDGSDTVIRQDVQHTAEYVASQPWTPFSMTSIAPAGTAQVKVEFATWGARGSVLWENAVLVVPEPGSLSFMGGLALLLGRRFSSQARCS